MTEQYKVSFGKVAKETAKEICKGVAYASKKIASYIAEPYIVPTIIRKSKEKGKPYNNVNDMAGSLGLNMGLQVTPYVILCSKGHYEVLAIPVLTNIASAIYEAGRCKKKDLENRVGEIK